MMNIRLSMSEGGLNLLCRLESESCFLAVMSCYQLPRRDLLFSLTLFLSISFRFLFFCFVSYPLLSLSSSPLSALFLPRFSLPSSIHLPSIFPPSPLPSPPPSSLHLPLHHPTRPIPRTYEEDEPQTYQQANITQTGEICLDLLNKAWSAAYTIAQTLTAVHQLLSDAAPDSPLNVDVAALLRSGDRVGAESLVRFYVREFRCED